MSDELLYKLLIEVEEGSSIDVVEEELESVLMDLYDCNTIEHILVKNKTKPIDDDLGEILSAIDEPSSKEIRLSIELAQSVMEKE
jgi:hypothetical protein